MKPLWNLELHDIVDKPKLSCFQKYGIKRSIKLANGKTLNDVHNGIDIVSDIDYRRMYAIADGKVLYFTNNDGTGSKTIVTAHGGLIDGYVLLVLYAHCNKFMITKSNTPIKKGQYIAEMGNSGNANGIHLHCSMYLIPNEIWHNEKDNTWYKWSYETREQYQINPNYVLGLY